ncbi:MAG: DUF116 domain-containing protein [Thermaerobacter sp.]|jgi:lipoate-protein ligase A|nr:DUF116 domain-containing protein [Thermaerobacter sp.]
MSWRLLDTGARPAAENMALDEVVLTARSRGLVPDTLRFLQFDPPCVLVGYHQAVEQEVREDYCRGHGVEINRRITGGGALYWDRSQLGWEIITAGYLGRAEDTYRRLCQGAILGLAELGVAASFRPANDIEVEGRKISGTGGTALEGAFLFQGTLLIDFPVEEMLRSLRLPAEKLRDKEVQSFRERVTWLSRELGHVPPLEAVKAALARGFARVLETAFEPGGLTAAEEELLRERLPRYRSPEWVHLRRARDTRRELLGVHKAPGGLIRVSLVADAGMVQSVLITGDFFAFPERLVYDLEAALKHAPLEEAALRERLETFFREEGRSTPGVTPEDFLRALLRAGERAEYRRLGLAEEEANAVFPVVRPLREVRGAGALLLPYCAKPLWCEHRLQDECAKCGRCTVGEAYRMAEERGLVPVSINNYEELEETLARLKAKGVHSFVGACCAAFYQKHLADFEAAGLPGVLVDIDDVTCYDLGQEREAHQGRYERETTLRLEVLRRVLDRAAADDAV